MDINEHDTAALAQHYMLERLSDARPEHPLAAFRAALRAQSDALAGRDDDDGIPYMSVPF
jgi:hypothetical protein